MPHCGDIEHKVSDVMSAETSFSITFAVALVQAGVGSTALSSLKIFKLKFFESELSNKFTPSLAYSFDSPLNFCTTAKLIVLFS